MRETSSNRRCNRARHIAFEERDEAKLHRLSPQRHPQGRDQGGRAQGGETRPAARRSRRPPRGGMGSRGRRWRRCPARGRRGRGVGRGHGVELERLCATPSYPPLRRSRARKVGPHSRQPGSAFSEEAAANRSRPTGGHRSASVPPDRGLGRPVRRGREGGRAGVDPGGRQDRRGERGREGD
jgi:hypothetical protein